MQDYINNTSKLVSIIIPVYNGQDYLREAIDSALAQTYCNIEILVVDDGSEDDTQQICKEYGESIRYYKKENGGVASAVNFGLKRMKGEYFSWLSHDDIYHPDKIEKQIIAIRSCGDDKAIVHGNYNVINERYHSVTHVKNDITYSLENMTKSVFPILLTAFHGCVPLVHKSYIDRVGMFDENLPLTQDYDFFFRIMKGQRTVFIREPLVDVRIHDRAGRVVNKDFDTACAKQYLGFARSLSKEEIRELFLDENIFYFRTASMVASRGLMREAALFLNETECANSIGHVFRGKLASVLNKPINSVAVFGMGFQGKMLCLELMGRGINISFMIDNNPELDGASFCGIPCVLPSEVVDEELTVIVSPEDNCSILRQLREYGIEKIITIQQLERILLESPPSNIEVIKKEILV